MLLYVVINSIEEFCYTPYIKNAAYKGTETACLVDEIRSALERFVEMNVWHKRPELI